MKTKTIYVCSECGAQAAKSFSICPECGEWNTFVEKKVEKSGKKAGFKPKSKSSVQNLSEIKSEGETRILTKIKELDRVLGGGIIPGSLVLVGGDPGVGKSTLMLQMCGGLEKYNPLYVTGEESLRQIKLRSQRIYGTPENLSVLAETNVEEIANAIESSDSQVTIVDSIQSVYSDRIDAAPGSVVQVRESAALLMQTAKKSGKAVFIVGHVTKEGVIAGPKILEHTVDAVLQFEGEKTYSYRILRAMKNRFGSTNEIGVFEMAERGLSEVKNPSDLFLSDRDEQSSGVAIVTSMEGARPLFLEVQALVTPTSYAAPQRIVSGYDYRRVNMALAVLEKRLGEKFSQNDVFVNVAGGVYLNDPAVDLGIAAALVSSLRDEPLPGECVLIGEIGLTGEIRAISAIERRLKEAEKLGFKKAILPKSNHSKLNSSYGIKLEPTDRISLVFAKLFT